MVAACVNALGVGTAALLWLGNPSEVAVGTTWWITLLVSTAAALLVNNFRRTRRAIGLFMYFLLTGLVLWVGLGSIGAGVFLGVAAIAVLFEANKRTGLLKAIAVAAVIFGMGAAVVPSFSGTAVAADANSQDLTIKPGELLPDAAKCGTDDKFNHNSMSDTKDQRGWGNSVSTPFKSTDKDAQFKELISEICVNPVLGDAYIQALTDAKIGDFSVAQANPWMKEFADKSGTKDGLKVWLTHKASDTKGLYVTDTDTGHYQYYAQMTNAVLYVLDNQGTKTATSKVNWPLGDLVADTLPRVHKEANPKKQENLPFMALTFTEKDQDCPYVLGVNVKDKRPENFDCKKAKEIAPPTPTKRKPPVITPPHPSGTPTKPGHTPTSTPSPTPSHTKPPKSCPSGQTGTPPNCLEIKDPTPIPTNSYHTPGTVTESAKPPVHPSQTATPTKPGSGSTQTAGGATTAPNPTKSVPAPEVSNEPTKPAEGCTNPITGEAC
jgi:hypothetical protein